MKLIILAAGKGKRLLPVTDIMPKGMVPILGKPLLEHVVEPYMPHVSDLVFVVSEPLGSQTKDFFKENYAGHKVLYRVQAKQKGTWDALMTCENLITEKELFCVCNGDDLLKERDIESAIREKAAGLGVSKKIMPRNYLGINIQNEYIAGFRRHHTEDSLVEDIFYNGFSILDKKIFEFEAVSTTDGELGLPQTLFANLDAYPLKAFAFESWETVNGPGNIASAENFVKSGKKRNA